MVVVFIIQISRCGKSCVLMYAIFQLISDVKNGHSRLGLYLVRLRVVPFFDFQLSKDCSSLSRGHMATLHYAPINHSGKGE